MTRNLMSHISKSTFRKDGCFLPFLNLFILRHLSVTSLKKTVVQTQQIISGNIYTT